MIDKDTILSNWDLSYYILTNNTKPTEPRTYRNFFNKLLKQLDTNLVCGIALEYSVPVAVTAFMWISMFGIYI